MYTVAIVDDEPAIREGLASHIDWHSMGFDLVGLFEDGEDVLQYLTHEHLDVVLTDIRMSVVSGLSLAQTISESRIQTEVVLLSGYKDFEFAQQAMKAGVSFYLLKPTDPIELGDVFGQVAERIRERELKPSRSQVQQLLNRTRAQVLARVVNGLIESEGELRDAFAASMLAIEGDETHLGYALMRATAEPSHAHDVQVLAELLSQDERDQKTVAVYEAPDLIHVLCLCSCRNDSLPATPRLASEAFASMLNKARVPCKSSDFDVVWEGMSLGVSEILALPEIIRHEVRVDLGSGGHEYAVPRIVCELIQAAPVNESQARRVFSEAVASAPPGNRLGHARRFCISLVSELLSETRRRRPNLAIGERIDFDRLIACASIADVSTWITTAIVSLTRELSRAPGVTDVVERACAYISTHVDDDLSLSGVARELFLSESYLSRIFRQETGSTFVHFVTETRLNRARDLLSTERTASVAEIAGRVGYHDPKYFSRLFREHFGSTPTEYRSMLRGSCG